MPFPDLIQPELGAYRSAVKTPEDFADFWDTTIAEARASGGAASITPVANSLRLVQAFDVTFPGFGGHPVKGWLVLPAQGSGWSTGATPDPVGSTPSLPGVMTKGILDRADYYYRRLFTDAVRAIDALAGQDFVDPDRIAVCGGSQGGGVTLAVAGIDSRIAAAMPDVPFLCDYPRAVQKALRDPYGEIVRFLAQHRDKKARVFETLNYFDGVNFARQAKAPALFSVALMDDICPPSTVYGAFHAYAGADKTMVEYEFNNHEGGQAFQDSEQMAWLGRLFGM